MLVVAGKTTSVVDISTSSNKQPKSKTPIKAARRFLRRGVRTIVFTGLSRTAALVSLPVIPLSRGVAVSTARLDILEGDADCRVVCVAAPIAGDSTVSIGGDDDDDRIVSNNWW